MTPEDQQQLTTFLNTFDAAGLGEGDLVAGVNTLAAMLCTVASVSRPGSGIVGPDRKLVQAGTNLLVSGALSSSIVTDDVINILQVRQHNLTSHLERVMKTRAQENREDRPKLIKFSDKTKVNESENALLSLLKESGVNLSPVANQWASVTYYPPNPDFEAITSNTKIVITAMRPSELETQLRGTHLGHPLVLLGLNRASGTERMSELCNALMDGRVPDGVGGKTVHGNLLVTDSGDMLSELARDGGEHVAWLGRLLWLVDSKAGPEVPDYEPTASPLGSVHDKFKSALALGLGKRLDHKSPYPVTHELDITPAQNRWVKFLLSMEGTLPCISGTARNLLATLVFGALELSSTPIRQAGTPNPLLGIEAFARLLVLRMANAHSLMTYSARQARNDKRNDELKERILQKLEEGPHTVRDLTRRFSRLSSEPCRELLHELEKLGQVQNLAGEWQLHDSTPQPTSSLTLDI